MIALVVQNYLLAKNGLSLAAILGANEDASEMIKMSVTEQLAVILLHCMTLTASPFGYLRVVLFDVMQHRWQVGKRLLATIRAIKWTLKGQRTMHCQQMRFQLVATISLEVLVAFVDWAID